MVGNKFNNDGHIQCWVGKQTTPLTTAPLNENTIASQFILAQTDSQKDSGETELAQTKAHNRLGRFSDLPAEDRIMLAQTINESNLSWTADAYLDMDSDGLSLAQTSSTTE